MACRADHRQEGAMSGHPSWPGDADEVLHGDLTAAAAYVTPAGGAVVTSVAPCGLADRDAGTVGFTTSLGFGRKLERIVRDPHVALAYHAREHGFSASPLFVLAQGTASVDLQPSRQRLEAMIPQAERFMGKVVRGRGWDWLLHEYYTERVFIDITLARLLRWPDLHAAGQREMTGTPWPGDPAPQQPPRNGTGPRVDVARAAARIGVLPHVLVGYRGADGFPVVVPVQLAGHNERGLRLVASDGLLPPGGRRAGLLAHAYRPQLVGLTTRVYTGWLESGPDGAVYAPHTAKGFTAPPRKNLLLVSNGLLAKFGLWQARRHDTAARLAELAGPPAAVTPAPPHRSAAPR
jgi:hypothetical protein